MKNAEVLRILWLNGKGKEGEKKQTLRGRRWKKKYTSIHNPSKNLGILQLGLCDLVLSGAEISVSRGC